MTRTAPPGRRLAPGKTEDEPGGHKFHYNVHVGTPGTQAFAQLNNPVSVGRDSCP